MKRIQLKENLYHPDRGNFDFIRAHDYQDKGDHIEVKSADSGIKYNIPKNNIKYISDS